MTARGETDWAGVEAEYRRGKLSIRRIATLCGVSEKAIRNRAKAAGWVRTSADLRTDADQPRQVVMPPRREVPVVAGAASSVDMGQDLARRMLGELDLSTTFQSEIEDAIFDETRDDENGQRRQLMLKAVSLPARAMTLKTIAQALAVLKDVEAGVEQGKKQQRQSNAEKSAAGRFAPPAAPKLVVNNGS